VDKPQNEGKQMFDLEKADKEINGLISEYFPETMKEHRLQKRLEAIETIISELEKKLEVK
jgi:hypothetical protein